MVYYKYFCGFIPTKSVVILISVLALIFYLLSLITLTSVYSVLIYYGPENPLESEITKLFGTHNWNSLSIILDLIFGFSSLGLIFGFVIQFLLIFGILKLKESYMLPWLILSTIILFVS